MQPSNAPASGRAALHWLAALACLASFALPFKASAAPVPSLQISVPHRLGPGQLEISALKITLQLDSSSPIALRVEQAGADGSGFLQTGNMILSSAANDCFASPQCFQDFPNPLPAGAAQPDRLTVIKPQQAGADPASSGNDKLVLLLRLRSNLNELASCAANPSFTLPESWTVSVVGGAARITGVAVQSLDKKTAVNCGTAFRPVPVNDTPIATVDGTAPILQGGRVGVDTVLVLDRSGSMSGSVSGVDATKKITRLHAAAGQFLDLWKTLRDTESVVAGGSPVTESPSDHVGIVYFDDEFDWLQHYVPISQVDGLKVFSALDIANEKANLATVDARGYTSIGGGLALAAGALAPAANEPNRKVILLMTDGMQNTPPYANANATQVFDGSGCPLPPAAPPAPGADPACSTLPNQPPIQIYPVTVGTGAAVDPAISQRLADATHGFMLNTENDAAILPNLFIQVLQNTIKYSTVETLRVISDSTRLKTAFTTEVPVTSTTSSLVFSLDWNARQGPVEISFTPPGGGGPIRFAPSATAGASTLTGGISFPLEGGADTAGLWTVRVTTNNDDPAGVPFNFTLLGDDTAVNSALAPVPAEYKVGDKIKLTAQVNDLEGPLRGLDTQPNARVEAAVVSPGKSVGDVLSDSAVQPAPPGPADQGSAAQRKLQAILAADPNALHRNSRVAKLVDDGSAASGDDQAGDGIYSALVPAEVEGHYNFVFFVQGETQSGGRFVRQQIRTVHARSLPDGGKTECATSAASVLVARGSAAAQALAVACTPRNVRGGKMGPGWSNYFWLTARGMAPIKLVEDQDKLDGTYTAVVPFNGVVPPKISLHFIPYPVYLPNGFVPKPETLGPGTTVIVDVSGEVDVQVQQLELWQWILLLLAIAVLLLLFWLKPKPV